jgi:hypothetical protein
MSSAPIQIRFSDVEFGKISPPGQRKSAVRLPQLEHRLPPPRIETDKIAVRLLRSLSLAFLAVKRTGLTVAVLLVGANGFTRLRSEDAVNGSVIITSASEPAL